MRPALPRATAALLIVAVLAVVASETLFPRSGLAQESDAPTCVLPPPDPALVERVRASIAAQPAPATPFPDGVSGEAHSMPYPPPSGGPLDQDTAIAVRSFLEQYAACVSTGPLGPVVGAWTEAKWVREFGNFPSSLDRTLSLMESTAATSFPPEVERLDLVALWQLADGRVVAVVNWVPVPPDPDGFFAVDTLVLAYQGGRWLIDDNWYGQGCYFVPPENCPYGPPDGTPFVTPAPFP